MSSQHLAVPIDVYKYSYNIMYTSTKAKLYACKKNRSLQGKGRYVHVCRRDTRKLLVMKPELLGKNPVSLDKAVRDETSSCRILIIKSF